MLKKNRLYGHRITMAVLSIAIIIGMVIPAFAKSSSYVASVGENGYTTLQAAVDSISDNGTGTILLLSDVTLSSTLSIGGGKKCHC